MSDWMCERHPNRTPELIDDCRLCRVAAQKNQEDRMKIYREAVEIDPWQPCSGCSGNASALCGDCEAAHRERTI